MASGTPFKVVDGQLIREPNPQGGVAGVMPQHVLPNSTMPEITRGSAGGMHTRLVDESGNPYSAVPTELTGSNLQYSEALPVVGTAKSELTTIINAQSVVAGDDVTVQFEPNSASEIWLLVNIDQQPWTLRTSTLYRAADASTIFPKHFSDTMTYTIFSAHVLVLGGVFSDNTGMPAPTNLTEAKNSIVAYPSPMDIKVSNESANTATVTVEAIKIWRGRY